MRKSSAPIFLSAKEAAAELSVSLPTLYAYVSRGLVRSEAGAEHRMRRYHAEDVRMLKNRRAPPVENAATNETALDWGTPVLDSRITAMGHDGPIYRGVPAVALADSASVEHVATLLWEVDSDPFTPAAMPIYSPAMKQVAKTLSEAHPIDRAQVMLTLGGAADPSAFNRRKEGRAIVAARILRLAFAAAANREPSAAPLHEQIADAWLAGAPAAKRKVAGDLIRRALVLLADHELNASTFTVRVAASTGLNLYDAVVAGLCAVKGPRHGGASARALRLVDHFLEDDPFAVVRSHTETGEKFAGFHHPLYKDGDPRAINLLRALEAVGANKRLTVDAPKAVYEAIGILPNIDFAIAILAHMFELPAGAEVSIFALARLAGWIAHANEQLDTGGLIRPRARYVGPAPR